MKAFHLTKIENLYGENGIIAKGLIPSNGNRSQSIKDENCAVYFSSSYYTMPTWWLYLYPKAHPQDLCVLAFDIADDHCVKKQETEYYTFDHIPPEAISVVHFYRGITNEEVQFIYLQENASYYGEWGSKPIPLAYTLGEIPVKRLIEKNTK